MIRRVTKLDVDGQNTFEIMADIQFVAHAHAAMKLNRLLTDKARGFADLGLSTRREFRCMPVPISDSQSEVLGQRARLFERDEHIDHSVLQGLKRAERHTKLLARLAVFKGRGI